MVIIIAVMVIKVMVIMVMVIIITNQLQNDPQIKCLQLRVFELERLGIS